MNIEVCPVGWCDSQVSNIEALLINTAAHLNDNLRVPFAGSIQVIPGQPELSPRVLLRNSSAERFTVLLSARDKYWCQFAYQFSHEFCHILSNFESLWGNPNGWFHESLCELASLYCLRRMSKTWAIAAPYPNWRDFRSSLSTYAEKRINRPEVKLSEGTTLSGWLAQQEKQLRNDSCKRDLNAVIACQLLPEFENLEAGWNAIGSLPNHTGTIDGYLKAWHKIADDRDKGFVARIRAALVGSGQLDAVYPL